MKTKFSIHKIFTVITLTSLFFFGSTGYSLQGVDAVAYYPPPLKQIKDGTSPTNVTCTEGFELVLKQSTGKPACLKPSSVAKLIERGWAIHILPDYAKDNNNSEIFPLGQYDVEVTLVPYFEETHGFLAKPTTQGSLPAIIMIH
ncbi:MAG: hypothetical protein OEQ12_07890, partial [Nitrosopumilus sp.]|nr:hypothetical protein [Nitrosopumilus sp.]